jgi:archaetidylinositol phosphate synthase
MSYNTWIHKVSRQMVKPLVDTPVTPNHLTTGRLLFGVAAAGAFALGETFWNWIGALCFLLSMILDRADGELARLGGTTSRFGAYYDLVTDAICNSVIFIGIGVATMQGSFGTWGLLLGIIAGISVSIIFLVIMQTEIQFGHGTATFDHTAGFDPDDAMIIVPIAVAVGFGDYLLIVAAVCSPIAAIIICRDLYQRRKQLLADKS